MNKIIIDIASLKKCPGGVSQVNDAESTPLYACSGSSQIGIIPVAFCVIKKKMNVRITNKMQIVSLIGVGFNACEYFIMALLI